MNPKANVLEMLEKAQAILLQATLEMNNLKSHPGFAYESVPELLRGHLQMGYALTVQAKNIWEKVQA